MSLSWNESRQDLIEDTVAWRSAADAIVAGICHELNGRIGAVSGLVQLARLDGEVDHATFDTLDAEIARMETLSRLLELLPAATHAAPEPLRPADLVPPALDLIRRHRGLDDVHVAVRATEVGPVAGHRTSLVKALVLLLADAIFAARAQEGGEVRLSLGEAADRAVIAIQPAGNAGGRAEAAGATRSSGDPSSADALIAARRAVAAAGGVVELVELEGAGGSAAYVVGLPRLPDDPEV